MNKYKEALKWIKNDIERSVSTEIYFRKAHENIGTLQELIDKEQKYCWHDLRKDPNDLPENNSIVIFAHCFVGKEIGYSLIKFNKYYIITKSDLAWKYIEEFEDE